MKKTNEVKSKYVVGRVVPLSVRLTPEDSVRLERIVKVLSAYVVVSKGKAISAALKIADEKLSVMPMGGK